MTHAHPSAGPCPSCGDDLKNPARIAVVGGKIRTVLEGGSGDMAIFGGGVPLFNAEDGAIGSHPSKANFLSKLQRSLEDSGFAPASLYGFSRTAPAEWYRPELLPSEESPEGFPEVRAAAWDDYLDGVNMGTYRGGLLGLLLGAGGMLAGLYFGGAMVHSPKAAPKTTATKPAGVLAAHSKHRSGGRKRKGH